MFINYIREYDKHINHNSLKQKILIIKEMNSNISINNITTYLLLQQAINQSNESFTGL
jgi:hypothetical protein